MEQEEDARVRAVLLQRVEAVAVVDEVLGHVAALDLENVNEDADVLEDGRALGGEVDVHEGVLSTTVPEIEDKVAEKADMVLLDVDGGPEARSQGSGIIGAGNRVRRTS